MMMKTIGLAGLSFGLGAFFWTFAEYAIHNWAGHKGRGKNEFSREHMTHHRKKGYFSPAFKKIQAALAAVVVVGIPSVLLVGPVLGSAFTTGFILMWMGYEYVHRICHTDAPTTAYGRWARKSHFLHHFMYANSNFGVTTPLWDFVFRTYRKPEVVRVPTSRVMVWLLDEDGEVKPEYANDYRVLKRKNAGKAEDEIASTEQATAAA